MQCNLDFHVAKKGPILHSSAGETFLSQHFRTSATTEPVVHPENEIQNNMVATQYLGELRVACGPAQLHLDHGQSQQNLNHQQESQANVVSTGFHYPRPKDSACTSRNIRHQINGEGNADFCSSAQVSAQHSSYFGTSANESSVSINCEQLRSNLNNNTGLQQRRHLNCASLSSTRCAAVQGVKEKYPLQDQCSSVTVCKKQISSPLLLGLLKGNTTDPKSFTTLSFLSEETNGNTEVNAIPHFSDIRHRKSQPSSQDALNCRQTRTQNLDHSRGTLSTSHQQQASSLSLSGQSSTGKGLPFGEMEPPTDAEIFDFIQQKLTYFRAVLAQKTRNYGVKAWDRNSTQQSDYTMPNSVSHLLTTSVSDKDVKKQSSKCAINEEFTATVGQALEKDSSKDSKANAELMPKFKETDCCVTYVSMNSDLTMPANGCCKLDDCDRHYSVTAHSELDSPVDKIQIHNIVSIPANQSEKLINQTSSEATRENAGSMCSQIHLSTAINENKVKEPATESEIEGREPHLQYENISDDDASQLATTLPNTTHEELSFPVCIKDPHYEDISDADSPQNENMTLETSQVPEPNNEQSLFHNEGYGHVQGQSQMKIKIIPDEEAIPKQQISPKTKTLEIAWQCTHSCFIETDFGFESLSCPKCNHETQTNPSASNSPFSETDDEMDYDCVLISMVDLKFEPEDGDQDSPQTNVQEGGETGQCDTATQTPQKPVLAFDFPQLPVYDTKESFIQAMKSNFEVASGKSTPQHEMVSERVQNRRQSIDSCETEDSCDYSSASERNYLTVPRKMLKKRSALTPSESDVSASENECKGDEVTNPPKCQTRSMDMSDCMQKLRGPIEAKAGCSKHVHPKTSGQQISKKFEVIVVETDTEDETYHDGKKKTKKKTKKKRRWFSSDSEDSGDARCSQQKRHLHGPVDQKRGIVEVNFPENRPSADSRAPLHQSNHDTSTEEIPQDACSYLSHSTEKSEQLPISKAASEHVEGVITVDSDTEDDNNQKYKNPCRKRFFSSESDSGDALYVEPETRQSSDSSLSQCQSKLHDTQLKNVMPEACSDLSHNRKKSGKLNEAKSSSAHVQHKANRQTTSKRAVVFYDFSMSNFSKKKADKGILSGGSSDALFATKDRHSTENVDHLCGTANKKPQKNRLSSEDSPEQRTHSVDRETGLSLGPNPVIPRFLVKPSPPNASLILLEEPRVHRQGRDGSPQTFTVSNKRICKMNKEHCCRNKPTNYRHHTTVNNAQSSVPKPRMDSRQTRQLSEASLNSASSRVLSPSEETSASSSLLTSKQTTITPGQYLPLSKLQQSHSHGSPSTSSFATMPLSAKEQLNKDWKKSFYPTKMDKKNSMRIEEDFRATNHSLREARQGPRHHDKTPRHRHKSEPSLLKKTKIDAIQRTKDINRDAPKERCPVGEGYKWSMKPTVAKPTKGSSRDGKKYRSPPRP